LNILLIFPSGSTTLGFNAIDIIFFIYIIYIYKKCHKIIISLIEFKKKLPKLNDHQLEFTGGTGAGKTNCLYDYIIQTSKPKKELLK